MPYPCRPGRAATTVPLLGFEGIPVSSEDAVIVPPGYTAKVLIAWGDPRVERARLQAGRQQHGGRAGAAVGHAQRRRRVLPVPRLVRTTACWCRTTNTPTTGSCFRTATPNWTPEKTSEVAERARRVGHRDQERTPPEGMGRSWRPWDEHGQHWRRRRERRLESRPTVRIRAAALTGQNADEDRRTGRHSGVRTRRIRA